MYVPPIVRVAVAFLAFLLVRVSASEARILDVGEGQEFSSIAAAVDAAMSGDTIDVHPGVYAEFPEPSVSLLVRGVEGAEETILEGEGSHRILEFAGVALTFEGITFRNGYADWPGGGAIRYHAGSLTLRDCVLRDNRARGRMGHLRSYGGAIYLYGGNASLVCHRCLFAGNEVIPRYGGFGGAVAFTIWTRPASGMRDHDDESMSDVRSMSSMEILDSSFIGNQATWTQGVYTSAEIAVEISRCVFFDIRDSDSAAFISSGGDPIVAECNLYWADRSPPPFDESKRGARSHVVADPRACPDLPEAIHESSPAADLPGCGPIGNLPIGCWGPMIVAARPRSLRPEAGQVLRVYGYGLTEPMEATLVGPDSERFPAEIQVVEGTWITLWLDLTGAPPGSWTLSMRPAGDEEAVFDGITVSPVQALGLLDGWVPSQVVYDDVMFGHGFHEGIDLHLRHRESETTVPLEINGTIRTDTLRVRADLSQAPTGIYDLQINMPGDGVVETPGVLFLGTPEILRVPDEYPTIRSALDAAPVCAEIIVSAGTYAESLVIDQPVRLHSAGDWGNTKLRPGAPGQRVLHILPEAGALTEISGFTIENGSPASGPGGGIWCEAPALIRDNNIKSNEANGPQGRGGGVFALDGCRIVDNTIYGNEAEGAGDRENPWSLDSDLSGAGGGIFCRSCLVDGNLIEANGAWTGGGFVVEGSFRNNTIHGNATSVSGTPQVGAVRGEVLHNWFDNQCGSDEPYLLIEGPARVGWNRFNDLIWDGCEWWAAIHLRGSIDFYHNTLANVIMEACLATQMSQSSPGRFRVWDNIFDGFVALHTNPEGYFCYYYGGADPLVPIPADSIWFDSNLRTHSAIELGGSPCPLCAFQGNPVFCEVPSLLEEGGYEGWYDLRLNTLSEALPAHSPAGCRDTLGAMGIGCGPDPVHLLSYGIESENGAVRLFWRMPLDVTVHGFHIEREADGIRERITEDPIPSCRDCECIDPSPPVADRLVYYLIILLPGEDEDFVLGEVQRNSLVPVDLVLRTPCPHPVRAETSITFGLPHPGGEVRLELFDLTGRRVAILQDGSLPSGWHRIAWSPSDRAGDDLSCGLYVLRLATKQATVTGKLILLR